MLRPLFGYVVLKPIETPEQNSAGIILPDSVDDTIKIGEVIATGTGSLTDTGVAIPLEVYTGDKVLYETPYAKKYKIEGTEYIIIEQRRLLGVI